MAWKPDYATAAQVKAFLRINDAVDDGEISSAATAASRTIDAFTCRQFGKVDTPELRTYKAHWDRHRPRHAWVVDVDDVYDGAGLVVQVAGVAVTKYTLEPLNAKAIGKPYTSLVFGVDAEARPTTTEPYVTVQTDKFGWSGVPVTVVQACKLQAGRYHKRRDALFGVAGSPADGSELRLLAKLDPDVQVMLSEYVRWWGAV